jgi:hypothetical protein
MMRRIFLWCLLVLLCGAAPVGAANDTARSPLIIDTATTSPIFNGTLRISNLRWVGVTAAGHKLVLADAKGRKIFETTAPAGASEYELPLPLNTSKGLTVLQIDSGIAYICYE